ncbi:MAG: type VII toxin-antitoxin system MntA family adenylyltransferase antitoxin [Pseudonocardia sp.]
MTPDQLAAQLHGRPEVAGLRLLVLHGSHGRGDAGPHSDWDLAFLADNHFDITGLVVALITVLGTDAVDVVDLATASALLRFRTARDGAPLIEQPAGEFEQFQIEAVRFWCDAGPVIRAAQDEVLAALG